MSGKIRVLVVGCGSMGTSHARAYRKMPEFEIVGVVSRKPDTRGKLSGELGGVAQFDNFDRALAATRPDAVSVNTYPDTHAQFAIKALRAGAHVFTEKPLAQTVEDAEEAVRAARQAGRKLVIGYILRVHPAWRRFIDIARTLGKPLVMRMNLNQQAKNKKEWDWHKNLMNALPAMVDCGVHYVDVMCQMTRAKPVRVHGIGALLTDELPKSTYNYGQLQVAFDDGSVGWYEAGWGPMVSEVAYFVKDAVGPRGCVSIVKAGEGAADAKSADIDSHTMTNCLRVHYSAMDAEGNPVRPDEIIDTSGEPSHQELCDLEQAYFLRAIREDLDLADHMTDAVNSLRIVLAADKSVRTGEVVHL